MRQLRARPAAHLEQDCSSSAPRLLLATTNTPVEYHIHPQLPIGAEGLESFELSRFVTLIDQ